MTYFIQATIFLNFQISERSYFLLLMYFKPTLNGGIRNQITSCFQAIGKGNFIDCKLLHETVSSLRACLSKSLKPN